MIGIYFSGTGNTQFCIETYVKAFDAHCTCFSIESDSVIEHLKKEDVIVLAYPIYYSNLPKIIQDFLQRTATLWKGKHVFLLTTMGLFSGDGCGCAARILKKFGANIVGGLQVKMPDCISDEKALKKPLARNQEIVLLAEKTCKEAASSHKNGYPYQQGLSLFSHMLGLLGQRLWFYRKTASYSGKLKIDRNSCTDCGLCASLCPMENIQILNGKAVADHHCTMCYRCVNHCPHQAITLLGKRVVEQSLVDKYLS